MIYLRPLPTTRAGLIAAIAAAETRREHLRSLGRLDSATAQEIAATLRELRNALKEMGA